MKTFYTECEDEIRRLLKHDSYVRYIIDSINAISNEKIDERIFRCVSFSAQTPREPPIVTLLGKSKDTPLAGYLWEDSIYGKKGHIFVNIDKLSKVERKKSNEIRSRIIHELIHAYDDKRANIDPSNCLHQACSEIRSAKLSGECEWSNQWRSGHFNLLHGGRACTKRHATASVAQNPMCRGLVAERSVEHTFNRCYHDNEPFIFPPYSLKHKY